MVINAPNAYDRILIKLDSGWLKYQQEFVYLGSIFSDQGTVNLHVTSKNKSVVIKLTNFMRNIEYAPVSENANFLRACLKSAVLYGQETWSSSMLHKIEML